MTAPIALALFSASISGLICFCFGWASRYSMDTAQRRPQSPILHSGQVAAHHSAASIKSTTQRLKQQSGAVDAAWV